MAKNDVQINIIGRDQASAAFKKVSDQAQASRKQIERFGQSTIQVKGILENAAGYAAAITGIEGIGAAFHHTLGEAFEFYKTMETGAISMAGTLMTMGEVNGKTLDWTQSLMMSKKLMLELSDAALTTGASTQEISDVFRAMLPNALSAGMTIKQTLSLASTLTTTGKAMGLQGNLLARDVQDLISGKNISRTKLGIILGLTSQDIANAKHSAEGLFNFLQDRLRGEAEANKHYLESYEGRVNHLKEAWARISGTGLSPFISQLTSELTTLADKLVGVDMENHSVLGLNKDFYEGIQNAGIVFSHLIEQGKTFASDMSGIVLPAINGIAAGIEWGAMHASALLKAFIGLTVAQKINYYVQDIRTGFTGAANAITGATEAETALGRAAQQTRLEYEAQAAALRQRDLDYNAAMAQHAAGKVVTITGSEGNLAAISAIKAEKAAQDELTAAIERTMAARMNTVDVSASVQFEMLRAAEAIKAGEEELARSIMLTTQAYEARGEVADVVVANMQRALLAMQNGETELAESILRTNAELIEQAGAGYTAGEAVKAGTAIAIQGQATLADATGLTTAEILNQGVVSMGTGVKVSQLGTAGAMAQRELAAQTVISTTAIEAQGVAGLSAGATIAKGMAVAGNAVRGLLSQVWNLAGGWLGVAIAVGVATKAMHDYQADVAAYDSLHQVTDQDGVSWTQHSNGQWERTDNVGKSGLARDAGLGNQPTGEQLEYLNKQMADREENLRQQQLQKEAKEMKDSYLHMKEVQQIAGIDDLMDSVQGRFSHGDGSEDAKEAAKANKEAAKQTKALAKANESYAKTIESNSKAIRDANNKLLSIIESLDEKILDETGSQFQIDMQKAENFYKKTQREIATTGTVNLKGFNRSAFTGQAASVGEAMIQATQDFFGTKYYYGGGHGDDGTNGLDCSGLINEAFKKLGININGTNDTFVEAAQSAGAFHAAGDGYTPKRGDIILSDNYMHSGIYVDDDTYIASNSSDGVGEHHNWSGAFSTSGYIDMNALAASVGVSVANAIQDTQATQATNLPNTDSIAVIKQAAQDMGFGNVNLLAALAAVESGGGDVNAINPWAYNSDSGATGMFQILDGQDVATANGRASIADLFPNYKTDPLENAKAAITMFNDKLSVADGDIDKAIKLYGENTDEYLNNVKAALATVGGDVDLTPTKRSTYYSPLMKTANEKNLEWHKLAVEKAKREQAIRVREAQSDIDVTSASLELTGGEDGRLAKLRAERDEKIAKNKDKLRDYYKATGDKELAERQMYVHQLAIISESEEKEREAMRNISEEYGKHLQAMGYLNGEFQAEIDRKRAAELERFIAYQKEQLETAQLTTQQRIELEEQYAAKIKEVRDLEAKTDWGAAIQKGIEHIKSYTQDIGTEINNTWDSVTNTIENGFSNMLTENKSFSERMRDIYINISNSILNMMMKIIMQGLIMHTVMKIFGIPAGGAGGGAGTGGATFNLQSGIGYSGIFGHYASGGIANEEWYVAGEHGAELIHNNGGAGYVYNASQTAKIFAGAGQGGAGTQAPQSVEVRIINESGKEVKAKSSESKFDGRKLIITTVLSAIGTNEMGSRDFLKGAIANG